MTQSLIHVSPGPLSGPSVLGNRQYSTQTGGKIRPGIKVLNKAAAGNPDARRIFEEGVAKGLSFDQIEKAIKAAVPSLERILNPMNVPYFTVRPGDFPMPEIADQIMGFYGEDRGDGVRRLYRFPVVFATDDVLQAIPHKLAAYGASGLKYWSEFSPDGQTRHCKTFAPVPTREGKAIRLFGGRKHELRHDNNGICDPENCPEYQCKACNVSGRFIFYVPAITSVMPLEVPTHSIYGITAALKTLKDIARMRGGRIAGFLHGREAFWMTKKLEDVPHIDTSGRATRVKQWIICLEVAIDLTRMLAAPGDAAAVTRAEQAAGILTGTATVVREAADVPEQTSVGADDDDIPVGEDGEGSAEPESRLQPPASSAAMQHATPCSQPQRPPSANEPAGVAQVRAVLAEMGVNGEHFIDYANQRFGAGWSKNPNGIRRALGEIEAYRGDAGALVDKITQTLSIGA